MADWELIKKEYIEGKGNQGELALRHGLHRSAIAMRAAKENWTAQRMAFLREMSELSNRLHRQELGYDACRGSDPISDQRQKMERMEQVSDKLLSRVSQAIDELDVQVLREVRKEKEMVYDHPQRADKATKEVLVEREVLTQVKAPVDRNGIKLLAAALKDIRDVQMLRDPTDLREQEAKIAKLEKEAREDKENDKSALAVTFTVDAEACSE